MNIYVSVIIMSNSTSEEPVNHNDEASASVGDADTEAAAEAAEEAAAAEAADLSKKHNSGATDLEKVTDYEEEKEVLSASTDLEEAIVIIRK